MWNQSPIMRDVWESRIRTDPKLAVRMRFNYTYKLHEELKYRTSGRNAIISIYGQTGSGKSRSALALAEYINRLYHTKNKPCIYFTPQEALEALPQLPTPNTVEIDEQIEQWGAGSQRIEKEITNLEETIRAKCVSLIFCSPRLQSHVAHFVLETYAYDEKSNLNKLIIYAPDTREPLGYVIIRGPSGTILKEYSEKKDGFLGKIKERTVGGSSQMADIAAAVMNDPVYLMCDNRDEKIGYLQVRYKTGYEEARRIIGLANLMKKSSLKGISGSILSPPPLSEANSSAHGAGPNREKAGKRRKRKDL